MIFLVFCESKLWLSNLIHSLEELKDLNDKPEVMEVFLANLESVSNSRECCLSKLYYVSLLWYRALFHIMCGYQCDKAVNKNDTRKVKWYHFTSRVWIVQSNRS